MKYECEKGSTLWTLWADLFLFWKEYGNVQSQADWDKFYFTLRDLNEKYRDTAEYDLCHAVALTLVDVTEKRWKEREKQ